MSHREETLTRLRDEDRSLERHIETRKQEAEHRSPGIRMFRNQRIEQLRERHTNLRERIRIVESHEDAAWDRVRHDAERLVQEIRDFAVVAAQTFH